MKLNLLLKDVIVFTVLAATISACSVQKRRYNKGWHIDWASSHSKTNKQEQPQKPVTTYTSTAVKETPAETIIAHADPKAPEALTAQQAVPSQKTGAEASKTIKPVKPVVIAKQKLKALKELKKPDANDNTDTLSILSFIFGLLGFLLIPAVVAIVLGNNALKQYRAGQGDPNKRIFALLGVIFGWIFVGLAILYILIIFLFLTVILGAI